jgi:bla regulator protein blaR1
MTSWVPFDLLDHLWQSTLFTAAVWLATRAVRTNAARVRYWLWLAASVKFLIPLSLLVSFGERFAWRTAAVAPPTAVSSVIEQVLTPAAAGVAAAPVVPIASAPPIAWPLVLLVAWGLGVAFVLSEWWRQWRPIKRALRDARPIDLHDDKSLKVLASASMIEPGVFGIWRQVLLVPEGISDRLAPAQLRALIAHERCHVLHHDNLTAALHMVVEALFWFHPLVWWLERRLIEERERACDEYVLQSGSTPRDYAEGILEVCRFAKDPSPVFVAGITGADLSRRIESILRNETARPLGLRQGVALLLCAAAAGIGPVVAGAVNTPAQQRDQSAGITEATFEVASIRRNVSGDLKEQWPTLGPNGQLDVINLRVSDIVQAAYQVGDHQVQGMPAWARTSRYDISARLDPRIAEASQPPRLPPTWGLALQALLKERFQLASHREITQRPVYALVLARSDRKVGPNLRPAEFDCDALKERAVAAARVGGPSPYPATTETRIACGVRPTPGRILQGGAGLIQFTAILSRAVGRPVFDRTGLTGKWDFLLTYTPDALLRAGEPPPADSPDLFTALREQLGLKLESITGPVEMFVVDRIEPPTEN